MIREGRSPADPWLPSDRLLALALTLHDQDVCSGCGGYKDECWDNAGDWSTAETVCGRCAALEQHQKDNDTPPPGLKVWPVSNTGNASGEVPPQFG